MYRMIDEDYDDDRLSGKLSTIDLNTRRISRDNAEVECQISKMVLQNQVFYLIMIKQF